MAGDSWKSMGKGVVGCGGAVLLLVVAGVVALLVVFMATNERDRRIETGGSIKGADFAAHCIVGLRLKAATDAEWAMARPSRSEPMVVSPDLPQAVTCMAEMPDGRLRPYTIRALCPEGASERCTKLG